MAPRIGIGAGGDAERAGVRHHVQAVGEQRHRAEDHAGRDLDHHHHRGQRHHQPGAAFVAVVIAAEEDVVVGPIVHRV
jgi:hypothetical protein